MSACSPITVRFAPSVWDHRGLCEQMRLGTAFVLVTDWRVILFTLRLQPAGTRADIAALSRPRLFMHTIYAHIMCHSVYKEHQTDRATY